MSRCRSRCREGERSWTSRLDTSTPGWRYDVFMQPATVPVLLCALSLTAMAATAEEFVPPEMRPDYKVPLTDEDLKAITLDLLQHFPMLASSPGIKYAEAHRLYYIERNGPASKEVAADVIFYPHAESAGIKYALQAYCQRGLAAGPWDCHTAEIRRYVKLDSQDFEVRVTGTLDLAGIQAVIAATRPLAAGAITKGSGIADTAVGVFEANGGYVVSWSTKDNMGGSAVEAHLLDGGDPANPDDWTVQFLPES